MALSMPEGVSTVRGVGLPARGRKGDSFGDGSAKPLQMHEAGHLANVAKGPRGDQYRVLELQATERDAKIDHEGSPPEDGSAGDRRRLEHPTPAAPYRQFG